MELSEAQAAPEAAKKSTSPARSLWIIVAITFQALWALTLIGLSIYLLVLTRGKPPDHAHGLRLGAVIILAFGLFAAAGWYGLAKRRLWGWWLSSLCDWGIVAVMVYAVIDDAIDEMLDWRMVTTTLFVMIVPVLLLLPFVRRAYRGQSTAPESV